MDCCSQSTHVSAALAEIPWEMVTTQKSTLTAVTAGVPVTSPVSEALVDFLAIICVGYTARWSSGCIISTLRYKEGKVLHPG